MAPTSAFLGFKIPIGLPFKSSLLHNNIPFGGSFLEGVDIERSPFVPYVGGPLAASKAIKKLLPKLDFGGPHGHLPPANPSIQVGDEAPHLN